MLEVTSYRLEKNPGLNPVLGSIIAESQLEEQVVPKPEEPAPHPEEAAPHPESKPQKPEQPTIVVESHKPQPPPSSSINPTPNKPTSPSSLNYTGKGKVLHYENIQFQGLKLFSYISFLKKIKISKFKNI